MSYRTLTATTQAALDRLVTAAIASGARTVGGPTVTTVERDLDAAPWVGRRHPVTVYSQAVEGGHA